MNAARGRRGNFSPLARFSLAAPRGRSWIAALTPVVASDRQHCEPGAFAATAAGGSWDTRRAARLGRRPVRVAAPARGGARGGRVNGDPDAFQRRRGRSDAPRLRGLRGAASGPGAGRPTPRAGPTRPCYAEVVSACQWGRRGGWYRSRHCSAARRVTAWVLEFLLLVAAIACTEPFHQAVLLEQFVSRLFLVGLGEPCPKCLDAKVQ